MDDAKGKPFFLKVKKSKKKKSFAKLKSTKYSNFRHFFNRIMLLLSICKNLSQYMLTRKAKNIALTFQKDVLLALLYCWHSCTVGTLVLLALLYCWHSCTVGTLVLLALLYCWHSCTVGTLVLLALLYCWHSCTAGTLVLLTLLCCWDSCTVGTLILLGTKFNNIVSINICSHF